MSLVVLEDVTLFFADRMIFDAASLRLGSHDRIGLVGPNGSGKTTLLKIIAGVQEIDDGKVTRARGVRVGWLPQDLALTGGKSLRVRARQRARAHRSSTSELAAAEAELTTRRRPRAPRRADRAGRARRPSCTSSRPTSIASSPSTRR
jgi:ATP-binding cassette subfamily F protein 3